MKLICQKCENGTLRWVDPEVGSLDGDMKCNKCGFVYHGMGEFVDATKARGNLKEMKR